MNTHHEDSDNYVLQSYVNGRWVTDRKVRKAGGANTARASAKNAGVSYRVYNTTKNATYVEVKP